MPSPYLLLIEVAEETRTALGTVRHWIATGRLASVRPGRRRLVLRSDLEAFLAMTASSRCTGDRARRRETTAPTAVAQQRAAERAMGDAAATAPTGMEPAAVTAVREPT